MFSKNKKHVSILFCLVIYSMAGGVITICGGRCGYGRRCNKYPL
jgi:hypothetical protein